MKAASLYMGVLLVANISCSANSEISSSLSNQVYQRVEYRSPMMFNSGNDNFKNSENDSVKKHFQRMEIFKKRTECLQNATTQEAVDACKQQGQESRKQLRINQQPEFYNQDLRQ